MHALRLGVQGVEPLTTGRMSLPVPEPDREYLRSVRRGEVSLEEVTAAIEASGSALETLRIGASVSVPPRPDSAWVNAWLYRSYLSYWRTLDE
jgi:hypothetical protein